MEELARKSRFEDLSYLLIWNHMPSVEEKQTYSKELALASEHVPQAVLNVVQSLP